jgi:hypothetical protein
MSTVRTRTLVTGAALAIAAFLLVDQGALFGSDLPEVALLGVAAGAVLGLVPDRFPASRLGGFLTGYVAAWLGYALRAGFLPDTPLGRAIAAVVVIAAITVVASATADRLPMWAGLLGAVTLLGAYETTFAATPTDFVSASMTAVTTSVLAAAFGFLMTVLLSAPGPTAEATAEQPPAVVQDAPVPAPRAAAESNVTIQEEVAR